MDAPPPPRFASIREYGDRLADVDFWEPYVRTVLARNGLRWAELEVGFVGTYPTFLAGDVVVKLFGRCCRRSWMATAGRPTMTSSGMR